MADKARILTTEAIQAFQTGDAAKADKLFKKLVTGKQTASPQAFYNYSVFLRQTGQRERATYWLERCLRAEPARVDAKLERALIHLEMKEVAAVPDLLTGLNDDDAKRTLALAQELLGEWDAALVVLSSLQNRIPEDGIAEIRCLLETGEIEKAEGVAASLRALGTVPEAALMKALTRRSTGRFTLVE